SPRSHSPRLWRVGVANRALPRPPRPPCATSSVAPGRSTSASRAPASASCTSVPGGHREVQILPGLAGHVLALAVLPPLGFPVGAVAVVEQGGEVRIGAHVHRPSGAAVAAVRSALGDELFATKR